MSCKLPSSSALLASNSLSGHTLLPAFLFCNVLVRSLASSGRPCTCSSAAYISCSLQILNNFYTTFRYDHHRPPSRSAASSILPFLIYHSLNPVAPSLQCMCPWQQLPGCPPPSSSTGHVASRFCGKIWSVIPASFSSSGLVREIAPSCSSKFHLLGALLEQTEHLTTQLLLLCVRLAHTLRVGLNCRLN